MPFLFPKPSSDAVGLARSGEAPVPMLSFEEFLELDEVQATEVASATATAILRAAQARHRELLAAASLVVDEAKP